MPCLFLLATLAFPRVVLVLLFLFTDFLHRAYDTLLIPLLGFIFLPITTIVYAWFVNARIPIDGINLLILIFAVILDVGSLGGGAYRRRY
jgi:UDP-N-acetylmuramyl pentapeptide phosphotransferase/UDP-N-acetylglucosamine-1-phosphate transferase